jgi:hypothetical protein
VNVCVHVHVHVKANVNTPTLLATALTTEFESSVVPPLGFSKGPVPFAGKLLPEYESPLRGGGGGYEGERQCERKRETE